VIRNNLGQLLRIAPFVALLLVLFFLALNPDALSLAWVGSAGRYLIGYMLTGFVLLIAIRFIFPKHQNMALATCAIVFLLIAVGLLQIFATIYVLLSCFSVGVLIRHYLKLNDEKVDIISATIFGAATYLFVFNLLISLLIHYRFFYFLIFAIPIVILVRSSQLSQPALKEANIYFKDVVHQISHAGRKSFFVFILILTFIAAYILFPTVNSDENTIHLSLWAQFDKNAFFTISPSSQIWSVAPVTLALTHAILSLLSGADAKGALNLLLLVMLLGSLFKLLRTLDLDREEKLALVTLFLSTPLLAYALVGLQTDLFLALIFCTASALLIDLFVEYRIAKALAVITISALAVSAKLPALAIAGPILIGVITATLKSRIYSSWNGATQLKIVLILALAGALALLPYVRAYLITGNPVFPLYNGIFKSEFAAPINFKDLRWASGANFTSYYGLFFNSKAHIEAANNFIGGFQYFLLAPLAAISVLILRKKYLICLLLLSLCYLGPMFFSLQYLRYLFAAFPLLSVLMGVFYLAGKKRGVYRTWLSASFYVTAAANILFLPGVCWIFFVSPFTFLMEKNRDIAVRDFMPEQQLNKEINAIKSNPTVLFAIGRPYGATLVGVPIYNAWDGGKYKVTKESWVTAEEFRTALYYWNVDFVYWDQKQSYSIGDVRRNLVSEVLVNYGKPILQVGGVVAFTIAESPILYQDILEYKKFTSLSEFGIAGDPAVAAGTITVTNRDVVSKAINLSAFSHFKYSIEFSCEQVADSFVAHLDFGNGRLYYKLVNCHEGLVSFTETGLIPAGTKDAAVALSGRSATSIKVHKLYVGAN
jgi:hypothetical protein